MLQVEKVENGYIVSDVDRTWVFNDYAELARFMRMWLNEGLRDGPGMAASVEASLHELRTREVVEIAGK